MSTLLKLHFRVFVQKRTIQLIDWILMSFLFRLMFICTYFVICQTHSSYNCFAFFLMMFFANLICTNKFFTTYWYQNVYFKADSFIYRLNEILMHFIINAMKTVIKTKITTFLVLIWVCSFFLLVIFFLIVRHKPHSSHICVDW